MTRLLLFDIDLTLIHSGGAGRLAMDRALERLFGVPHLTEGIRLDGRTDKAIFLEAIGRYSDEPETHLEKLKATYLEELPGALEEREGMVLPGVYPLLEALRVEDAAIGLATGNMEKGAQAKLRPHGLWESFRGGGFGDNTVIRSDIITGAIASIAAEHGLEPDPANAVVIGDTPLDIEAARTAGARTLGVATGRFSTAELLESGAGHAVVDLSDTARVAEMLLG